MKAYPPRVFGSRSTAMRERPVSPGTLHSEYCRTSPLAMFTSTCEPALKWGSDEPSQFFSSKLTISSASRVFFVTRTSRSRSEEHTSELQSLMRISYAVFCLKKNNSTNYNVHHNYCIIIFKYI